MAFDNFYLTDAGNALLARAQTGTPLTITRAQIGEGTWPEGTNYANIKALVQPVKYLPIAENTASSGQARIKVQFSNSGVGRPFQWREFGLWAADPDRPEDRSADILYGTAYAREAPVPIGSTLTEFLFNTILKTGRAASVTVTIDSSLVYVSQEQLEEALKDVGGGLVVIPEGSTVPPEQRKEGFLYFRVRDEKTIMVSPELKLKL